MGAEMTDLRRYRRKEETHVLAVQLDLETDGFTYRKWGAEQFCKPGDWLVNNGGDTYTIDGDTFERTYAEVSPGVYRKVARIWAAVADEPGVIATQEGATHYQAGDYLVYANRRLEDGYAISAERFTSLYELDD
jgi:hypothetical protein